MYLNRVFNCSVEALFQWMVDPVLLAQWFGPKHLAVGQIENVLEEGGPYRIELRKVNENSFFIEGEYLKIKKPHQLVFSYHYRGLKNPPPDSIVEISLLPLGDKQTKLSLIQRFSSVPLDLDTRTQAWEYMFSILEMNLLSH